MDLVLIGEILAVLMFVGVIGTLLLGFPVAFSLAGTSLVFALVGWLVGVFDPSNFGALASRYIGFMTNEVLVAVPLFIFMGIVLERSNLAEELLTTMGRVFGSLRGGLAFSVIAVGALLAASTGVVGATVVTMGLISLPAMLRAGYDPKLACGVICASGTLGQIIPPSTVLIFMGDMLAGINAQVQMAKGNFAPTPVSVGDLFAGAMIPGLLLVGLYFLYALWKAIFDPKSCPAMVVSDAERAALGRDVLTTLLPPLLLIVTVLGSILGGHRHADRVGLGGRRRRHRPGRRQAALQPADAARGDGQHRHRHLDGVRDPARRGGVLDRVPDDGRRQPRARDPVRSAGRRDGRADRRHVRDVPARLHPRHLRDHLHRHPDHRTGAAQPGRRSAVARRAGRA